MTGTQFSQLRRAGEYKQARLAQALGVSAPVLSALEQSEEQMSEAQKHKLLHALYTYRETREAEFAQAERELVSQ